LQPAAACTMCATCARALTFIFARATPAP
jgi:hypothetical protein